MIKCKDVNVAGREIPQNGEDLDVSIARLLGLRAELQDGILKTWPMSAAPDESSWSVGTRYTTEPEKTAEMLAERGIKHIFREEGGFNRCVLGIDGSHVATPLCESEGGALAAALWIVLANQSQVTCK